jgi:hypothetical protein
MARAVARQKQIPYALIIFVFLFVLAAIFAVMMFTKNDENLAIVAQLQAERDQYATEVQLRDDEDLRARLNTFRDGDDNPTVTEQYQAELAVFAGYLSGTDDITAALVEYKEWKEAMFDEDNITDRDHEEILAGLNGSSLIDVTRVLNDRWLDSRRKASDATSAVINRDGTIKTLENENRELSDLVGVKVEDIKADFDAREASLMDQLAVKDATIDAQQTRLDDLGETHSETLGRKTEQINQLSADLRNRNIEIAALNTEIARLLKYDLTEGLVIFPDGAISKVIDDETCYISLGSSNGIIPDMTFAIYPSDEDETIDGPKAKLVVKRVLADSAQCTIVQANPRNPVVVGDVVANIAYDKDRPHLFAVIGDFDLTGGSYPTSEEADKVKALIRKYGGEVTDTIDAQTDFVVMGFEPTEPTEPLDDDQINWNNYYRAQREYDEYHDARAQALDMQIRLLNTNRFLERIGYVPSQTLTYDEDE